MVKQVCAANVTDIISYTSDINTGQNLHVLTKNTISYITKKFTDVFRSVFRMKSNYTFTALENNTIIILIIMVLIIVD